jgi:hypothetical protein
LQCTKPNQTTTKQISAHPSFSTCQEHHLDLLSFLDLVALKSVQKSFNSNCNCQISVSSVNIQLNSAIHHILREACFLTKLDQQLSGSKQRPSSAPPRFDPPRAFKPNLFAFATQAR